MSQRITQGELKTRARTINMLLSAPAVPFHRTADGDLVWNIGHYQISYAYGGAALHRIVSEGGGIRDVFGVGHMPKRELFDLMGAFSLGLQVAEQHQREEEESA